MASFDINEVARRVQSTSTGQDGPYTFNFQVNAASEIQVFRNDTLQTESTHYNTTLNTDGTGSITFIDTSGSGGTDHSPTSGDVITIIGDQPLSRTTVFSTGSVNQPATLETEFDNVVIRQQQLKEMMDRSIQLKASTRRTVTGTGTSGPLQFPYDDTASNNASKVIAYDSNGTSLELGPTTANLTTLAGIASDISTVAGISSNVTSVAGNATNINTVAGISSNVTAVADNTTNINAVNSNSSNINTVAGANSNISTVAGANSNITTLAGINSDITTVAGISSNVTTVAGISSAVSTVASANSNISTVAGSISNVNTTAGSISNVNTVAGSISNVNTVASNVTGVNSFAERYRVASSAPSSSLDVGDLYFDTTADELKVYKSSGWAAAGSSVNGTAARFQYDVTSSTTTITGSDKNGETLAYDAGFVDVYLNGVRMVNGTDVTVTSGTSVVFASAIGTSGTDTVDIIAFGTFNVASVAASAITSGTLSTARGGTGLSSIGSADQVLQVNSGASALEFGKIATANIDDNAITNAKMADDSVGSAELIDNSVGAAALNISGNGSSGQMIVSDADGSFSYADQPSSGGFSLASALSGTTPTINWSSATAFSHTLSGDTTYSFSNVPSGGEIELFLKNVGKTMDVLTFNASTDLNLIGTLSTGGSFGSWFNNDGSRWYVTDNATNNPIREYNLSTNYSIATASLSRTSSGSLPNTLRYHCEFNGDGTKLIGYKADLVEHTLSTAYDISSLSTSANHTIDVDALFQSSGGGDSVTAFGGGSLRFNNDGTRLFLSHRDTADIEVPRAIVVKLSTAYDIDSTLTVESEWFAQPHKDGLGTSGTKITSVMSYDGTTIVCAEHNDQAGETGHAVFWHYNLSVPWDLSSTRFVGSVKQDLNASAATGIENLHITPDNKFMYFTEFKISTSDNGYFQVFDIQGDYKVTLPSGVTTLPASFGDGEDPTTTSYLRLVSLDGSNVLITDHREIL